MTYEAVNNIPFIKDVIITCTYMMYVNPTTVRSRPRWPLVGPVKKIITQMNDGEFYISKYICFI